MEEYVERRASAQPENVRSLTAIGVNRNSAIHVSRDTYARETVALRSHRRTSGTTNELVRRMLRRAQGCWRMCLSHRAACQGDPERLPARWPASASSRRQSAVIGREDSEVVQAVDVVVDSDLPDAFSDANVGRRRQCRSRRSRTQPSGWCHTCTLGGQNRPLVALPDPVSLWRWSGRLRPGRRSAYPDDLLPPSRHPVVTGATRRKAADAATCV